MTPKLSLYIHTPTPLFKARVNMASASYPLMQIVYDGVTLGAYTDIPYNATLTLGTTEGGDDLGRVRIQKPEQTPNIIYVARSSLGVEDGTLDVQDNAYITVWEDYRVWAKLPVFDLEAGLDYKDGDIPVGTFLTSIPPVANAGPPWAGTIDPATSLATVTFPQDGVNNSFAMADGATITTYFWDVGDGTITVGTSASSVITATFPAGFRYVALTVTDSNGVSHTSKTPVLTIDPASDPRVQHWTGSQRLDITGISLDLEIFDDLPRVSYPDGTLVLLWWDEPLSAADRTHIKFYGWIDNEDANIGRKKEGLVKSTKLHCLDVAGRLGKLPGFPQALSRVEEESPWSYMPSLDMSKSLHYLLLWHSTALDLVDFILPVDGGDYNAMRLDASGATLLQQVSSQAQKLVPDHWLTCNSRGQMNFLRDWRLDDPVDRPAVTHTITEDYWNNLQFTYNRHPKVHVLRSGAILSSTAFVDDGAGNDTLPLVFSIAPGDAGAFGQGTSEQTENEGLALSQLALNTSEGHRYAMVNSRYGPFSFDDPSGSDFWNYEPALLRRVQLDVGEDKAAQRGLDFTSAAGLIKEISVSYEVSKRGTVVKAGATWEKETSGYPAMTFVPEDAEDVGYIPPPVVTPFVPDNGLIGGVNKVALVDDQGYIYRTSNFQDASPTWDRVQDDSTQLGQYTYSYVVDPFSPLYRQTGSTVNFYYADATGVHKINDMFGIPTWQASGYFNQMGVYGTANSDQWRTVEASFGRFFETETDNPWLMVISYVGAGDASLPGTNAIYSLDAGATWNDAIPTAVTEIYLNGFYDSDAVAHGLQPIGVYLSPKTPGLAYTFAYDETKTPAEGVGYKTEDWGATWVQVTGTLVESPSAPLPHWGIFDDDNNLLTDTIVGGRISFSLELVQVDGSGGENTGVWNLLLALPANAVRAELSCSYAHTYSQDISGGGSTAAGATYSLVKPTEIGETEDLTFTPAAANSSTGQEFTITWTKLSGATWKGNRDELALGDPITNSNFARFRLQLTATATGTADMTNRLVHTATVTEIELDDGTIYSPTPTTGFNAGHSLGYALHSPWPDNDAEDIFYHGWADRLSTLQYRLKRVMNGATEDISPVVSTIPYGVAAALYPGDIDVSTQTQAFGVKFGVRTYDGNRNYVALAGMGNDSTSDINDNLFAVFVSSDAGDSWNNIIAPLAASSPHPQEVSFGGDSEQVLFIWGTKGYIAYSDDFGATIQDKTGNLISSFTTIGNIIGIAGGDTPA